MESAHYAGSAACEKCHAEIYSRWKKTPMANVVRDPRRTSGRHYPRSVQSPIRWSHLRRMRSPCLRQQLEAAILQESRGRFLSTAGSMGRYAQIWRAYFREAWNRLVGPLLSRGQYAAPHRTDRATDAIPSNYDVHTKKVTEWNVGCEKCHGPGSDTRETPTRGNIVNPGEHELC